MNELYRIGQYSVVSSGQRFGVFAGQDLVAVYDNLDGAKHAVRNLARGYALP